MDVIISGLKSVLFNVSRSDDSDALTEADNFWVMGTLGTEDAVGTFGLSVS